MKGYLFAALALGITIAASGCGSEETNGVVFETACTTVSESVATTATSTAFTESSTVSESTTVSESETSDFVVFDSTTCAETTTESVITTTEATTTTAEPAETEIEIPFVSVDAITDMVFKVDGKLWKIGDFYDSEDALLFDLEEQGIEYVLADSSVLTAEMLENRNGKVIVERSICWIVDFDDKIGETINSDGGFYTSYKNVDFPNSYPMAVVSYFVYNPENNYVDDIIMRYDLPIGDLIKEVSE